MRLAQAPFYTGQVKMALGGLSLGLWLCWLCAPCFVGGAIWRCLYKEFPVDNQKIKGNWWIYGTSPNATKRCMFPELDLYWTRITMTDYDNFAVELHCTLPWFRHQMAIFTRAKDPGAEVINKVDEYLKTVKLSVQDFKLVDKQSCENLTDVPVQRWHMSKYQHLDYHPHYVRPLVVNPNT